MTKNAGRTWNPGCVPLVMLLLGCGGPSVPQIQDRVTKAGEYDEAEMEAAIQQARASFSEFEKRLANPERGDAGFAIKVKITDGDEGEHFWLQEVRPLGDGKYSGIVANEPSSVRSVRYGQRITFPFEDVSDWMYAHNGVVQGNYTLRVLLKTLPDEEAAQMKKQLGWE